MLGSFPYGFILLYLRIKNQKHDQPPGRTARSHHASRNDESGPRRGRVRRAERQGGHALDATAVDPLGQRNQNGCGNGDQQGHER